jgi:signal peptidase I
MDTTTTLGATPAVKKRRGALALLRDAVVIVVVAGLVAFLVNTFVARVFYIPSASMEPTLQIDDRIVVDKLTPQFGGYHRGDVVVFDAPQGWVAGSEGEQLVKRVIGLPGDRVTCCDAEGRLSVNGVAVTEGYVQLPPGVTAVSGTPFDVTVPAGQLWVMGDNRYNSADSRAHATAPGHGFVPIDHVVGRAWTTILPLPRVGVIDGHGDAFVHVPSPAA